VTVAVQTGLWQLDQAASTVAVQHKTMWGMVTVKGSFTTFSGQGEVLPDGSTRGTVTLDAASLDTKNAARDKHLRSADFFDADRNPTITFAIRNTVLGADDSVQIAGQLTVRGITRPQSVTATVTDSSPEALTLAAEFIVDRSQYEMSWNRLGMIRGLTTVTSTLRFTRVPS
jgi:polyisoprenoid-binding protein YceI